MFTTTYPVDWKMLYCLLEIASLLFLLGMTCKQQMHAGNAVLLHVVLALPHLGADKVSDKAVQTPLCHDWTIAILIWEVIWLRLIANTKHVWECDSFSCCIKLRCNIWHVVLIIVICAKCAAVWEGCVWRCVSSCCENVSDAHHPEVTATGAGQEVGQWVG